MRIANEELLRLPRVDSGRIIIVDGREMREMIWRDIDGGDTRIIVQNHDERGAYMWADGFVIEPSGKRRPLTEVERREYL
jgi:hypothetical protein